MAARCSRDTSSPSKADLDAEDYRIGKVCRSYAQPHRVTDDSQTRSQYGSVLPPEPGQQYRMPKRTVSAIKHSAKE